MQFLWTPYRNVEVSLVTRAFVPLICFATMELHQANHVMRQFDFPQHIPLDPLNTNKLLKEDMKGRTDRYWPQYHQEWICGMIVTIL